MGETYSVVVTRQAENSLKAIVEYLIDTASDNVAEKVRLGLVEEIRNLAERPHKNPLLQGLGQLTIDYRRVLKWSYRIIYTIEEEDQLVIVVEIDHSSRNPQELEKVLI